MQVVKAAKQECELKTDFIFMIKIYELGELNT